MSSSQEASAPSQGALPPVWAVTANEVLARYDATPAGLSSAEAQKRLNQYGPNALIEHAGVAPLRLLLRQFRSPLVLILIFAAIVSAGVGDGQEAVIIGSIILSSCGLSFWQEYGASQAMAALKQRLSRTAHVRRDGQESDILVEAIVPGDVVMLSAGDLIPADGVLLDAKTLNISESALTGEPFPVVKSPGLCAAGTGLGARTNCVFTGASVRSGSGSFVAVATGAKTEFARIADAIARHVPETDFARGIRHFGYLMTEVMLAIVILVFFANILLHKPLIESLLFSLALAVGLTPELLPAIISVTLARGAAAMAKQGVIVRRLEAIENLGSMDVLCTDKTGTLTEGVVKLDRWTDASGASSAAVLRWARLNALLQTGMRNPLDAAIAGVASDFESAKPQKVDEIPYDFVRKRLSVIVQESAARDLLICKGAVQNVLDVCSTVMTSPDASAPLHAAARDAIMQLFQGWSEEGFRVLAVATRSFAARPRYERQDEAELCFAGFLLFFDPPKQGVAEAIEALAARGVSVKMISGDNRHVARHLAQTIGLRSGVVMTGEELATLTKASLFGSVDNTDIFAEIDPNQKERIVEALQRRGHVVGYLGDGINDAPALHEADVGISVDSAVDVAREAADVILLRRDLDVLMRGIDDGRRTFANTMKYIAITTSANFGNMISMAIASLFLPFLPMLAKQILLNNLLSDLPALAIAGDNVEDEDVRTPRRWDIAFVRRFMVRFGLISSLFDVATFAFLLIVMKAGAAVFQTGWFMESLLTELAIVLVIRTRRPAWRSRPSRLLTWLSIAVAVLAIAIPHLPGAGWFGFVPLPPSVIAGMIAITAAYMLASEWLKHLFFRSEKRRAITRGAETAKI